MDDSGLNIGMDTGDETTSMAGGVLSSNIGSASNVQDEQDTYFFETSSDSFSLANQKKSPNESGNLSNEHYNNTNLSTASSLSSSGSISEELIANETCTAPRIDHIEILVTKDSRRVSLTDDRYLDNSIDYDDAEDEEEEEDDDDEDGDFMSESKSEECLKVELVHRHDEPVEAEVKKCLSGDEMCMTAEAVVVSVYENGQRECEEVRDERPCVLDSSTSSSSSFSSTELEKTQILDQAMATGECCFESNGELNDKKAVEEIDDEKLNENNNKGLCIKHNF